jgi:hypothetical protein
MLVNEENTVENLVTVSHGRPGRFERGLDRVIHFLEDIIKKPVFKCQGCGECILSHTGFVCSQRCPKRLRNGPCGGTGVNGTCEVYPERKCIWYLIYRRARFFKRISLLYRIEKMHNWELEKTSAVLNLFRKRIEPPTLFIRRK